MPQVVLTPTATTLSPITLESDPITIGRHPDNLIVLRQDDLASRFHCVVEPTGNEGAIVKDLGSRNGTRVNDVPIRDAPLNDGDVLVVGRHTFNVSLVRSKKERRRDARKRSGVADPPWVIDLRQVIEELPPKRTADEAVVMINADNAPSTALDSESEGAVAIRLLLLVASKGRATDIHLEPKGDIIAVRVRVDGSMVHIVDLPNTVGELALGLVRTACQVAQTAKDAVIDGHFGARYQDRRVDFRASFTPTVHGQKLVIRVLDGKTAPQNLDALQLPAYMQQRLERFCNQDAGMLLACGPTGSGKTTTLYNCIRTINRQVRNVVTIEDPVEYHLDNTTQIPISARQGFGEILRSVLRQDPDVILVGEIRDDETARTAMQAAMTGHLVFSTVHAKDTISSVFRLLDLGVEPYLVASSLELIMAQRLVKTLCDRCKRPVPVTPSQATRMGRYLRNKDTLYAATGCAHCLRTGYSGRRALFELLDFNDELRDCVLTKPSIQTMKGIIEQGVFTTLQQAGYGLVSNGESPLDEIERVTGGW